MRILQLIQRPQLRGAEVFASQLSEHLRRSGHEVKVVCLFSGDAVLPFSGAISRLDRPESRRFWDWTGWKQLAKIINDFQPQVVQANAGDTLKYAVFSRMFFHWKALLVYRNANKVSDFVRSPVQRVFHGFLARRADHVISVSELCRQDFVNTFSLHDAQTSMVPVGIERVEVKRELPADLAKLFHGSKVLLHVASFVPEKNHDGLIRILRMVLASREDVKCLLVGDGRLRDRIERQIVEMNLSDRVYPLGYRTDVLSLMSNASALVLPSLIEGLPAVLLEAMYCNTPVVAYDVGGIGEVVIPGATGWLVPAGEEELFASAILDILSGHKVVSTLAGAYQMVERNYDNAIVAQRFFEVYDKCLARKPGLA